MHTIQLQGRPRVERRANVKYVGCHWLLDCQCYLACSPIQDNGGQAASGTQAGPEKGDTGNPPILSWTRARAFTLIEVLVVVAIIAVLVSILVASLSAAREQSRRVICQSNLQQLQKANVFYLQAFKGIFPPHRFEAYGDPLADNTGEKHWFHLLGQYARGKELPHCPTLKWDVQQDANTWSWSYNSKNIGYGYNAFFLGLYNHQDGETCRTYIEGRLWWPENRIKRPADNILLGDSNPKPGGDWSSTLWWPYINRAKEGLNGTRHRGKGGNLVFNDGHAEFRRTKSINPERDNTDQYIRFWDPLQRPKPSGP